MPPTPRQRADAERRARAFLERVPLLDGHNDLPYVIYTRTRGDLAEFDIARDRDDHDTDIPKLRRGLVGAQVWAVFLPTFTPDPCRVRLEILDIILEMERRYPGTFLPARRAADVARARRLGKIASFIGIEGGVGLAGSFGQLGAWQAAGARLMTLCHNETLEWIDSATDEPRVGGLSIFGRAVIWHLNRLGIVIDCSHASPKAARDVLDTTRAPIVLSHSGSYTLCDHPRNAPDDVIDRIAAGGGVIMPTFVPAFVSQALWDWQRPLNDNHGRRRADFAARHAARTAAAGPCPRATLAQYCDHVEYVANRVGHRHVGIGSDYFGGDTIEGLEDAGNFPAIFAELMLRGWSDAALAGLASGNFLRVMRRVETVSRDIAAGRG
jgi:membrane dipeptidase